MTDHQQKKYHSQNKREASWPYGIGHPYVFNTSKAYTVDKIMFQCSMRDKLTDELTVDWELIDRRFGCL
jgi:hypothetical protein